MWGILHEGFDPAREASKFPEVRGMRLVHDLHEMIADPPYRSGGSVANMVRYKTPGSRWYVHSRSISHHARSDDGLFLMSISCLGSWIKYYKLFQVLIEAIADHLIH
jgi:hypothetical protein